MIRVLPEYNYRANLMYDFCFQVAKDVEIAAEVDQPAVTAVDH